MYASIQRLISILRKCETKMESEHSANAQTELKSQPLEHIPVSHTSIIEITPGVHDTQILSQHIPDDQIFPLSESHLEESFRNFDPYSCLSISKRSRGRPRKDATGRNPVHIQQRKMFRGRGRPKREDGCSTMLHPKIFPGRPRARSKKFRSFFTPPHLLKPSQSNKHDIEMLCDMQDPLLVSGESATDCFNFSPDIPSPKLPFVAFQKIKCALCNLGDGSALGQGKLRLFKPTTGVLQPSLTCAQDSVSFLGEKFTHSIEDEKELILLQKKHKHKSLKTSQESTKFRHKPSLDKSAAEALGIGFLIPPENKQLFQLSGEIYAHFNCALWSAEVVKSDNDLLYVDKAAINGMLQPCTKCKKFGATVKCSVEGCREVYHYPCAVISGAFQNIKTMKLFCLSHIHAITDFDMACHICKILEKLEELTLCTLCLKYYHRSCLGSQDPSAIEKAGWQCTECKTCQTCRQAGDEHKMLVCETCDKGYHTFCLKPVLASVPKSGWKCHGCRICGDCGAKTPGSGPSSRWHLNYTVCDSCYQQRNKGVACPLCGKAYRQSSQKKEMRHCCVCRKYIHVECDVVPDQTANPLEYVCPICTNPVELEDNTDGQKDLVKSPPEIILSSSRESLTSGNEHSASSGDSDSASEMDEISSKQLSKSSSPAVMLSPDQSPSRFAIRDYPIGYKIPIRKRHAIGRPKTQGKLMAKRRAKTAEFQRRRKSPKQKKSLTMPGALFFPSSFAELKEYKTEDDDPSAENKMVLVSASDEFVLCQDLCVMCGSLGKGEEGRLIACVQCGQCYHSYCARIKVTPVVLKKGWRCLDCTVCEGCGKPHDESRLLLCDECDISFHIYCLNPPLSEVPPGNWKCKWCVICIVCGSRSPGYNCDWQVNYTHCGPCASFVTCPICLKNYEENSLIIQCAQCNRWSHGKCDEIENEEEAEKCADFGYLCKLCRPPDDLPPHLLPPPLPPTPEPEPIEKVPSPQPKKEPENPVKTKQPVPFYLDGVCLSEIGLQHIKSVTIETPKKNPRPRKPRQHSLSLGSLQNPLRYSSPFANMEGFDPGVQLVQSNTEIISELKSEFEAKTEIDDDTRIANIDSSKKEIFADDDKKQKRPRKIQKLGIGGFVVKPRGRSSSTKETASEIDMFAESGQMPTLSGDISHLLGMENTETSAQEKPKRRRKPKRKTPLDESFPSYLRDAFFGKDLLVSCKKAAPLYDSSFQEDLSVDSTNMSIDKNQKLRETTTAPQRNLNECTSAENCTSGHSTDLQSSDVLPEENKSPLPSQVNTSVREMKPSTPNRTNEAVGRNSTGFPQMDSKEVEDVFEGVLRDEVASQSSQLRVKEGAVTARVSGFLSDASVNSPLSVKPQPQTGSSFALQRNPTQIHTQSSPVHRETTPSLHHQDSNSSWSESETSSDQTQMQKNTMKWESDEHLGLLSTISPVLYANINCPHLKIEYPNWTDRVKQITKIWRSLPSEKRQPYLQKARENRSASRSQKSSTPVDLDRTTKEPKTQELDHEKQWKQFQALRQLQQQKQLKILQEQRAQALLKAQVEKMENSPAFSTMEGTIKSGPVPDFIPQASQTESQDIAMCIFKEGKNTFDKMPPVSKAEEFNISHLPPNQQQGKFDMSPAPLRPLLPGRAQLSPYMEVTRCRPNMDHGRLSLPGESLSALQSPQTNMSPEHYSATQAILTPRGIAAQPHFNRMPYSPTSSVPRQSLLVSRPEMSRANLPLPKDILYTSPSTPRPQSSESFFPTAVSPRAHFFVSVDNQSPILNRKNSAPSPFQPTAVESGIYATSPKNNANRFIVESVTSATTSITDVLACSKPYYSHPTSSVLVNKSAPPPQTQLSVSPTLIDNSKGKISSSAMMATEHFIHPQSVPSSPGTPRPAAISSQECIIPHPAFEHILKENPDPNKLMAHHQLRELLQKQQMNKADDVVQQLPRVPRGVYSTTAVQFVSKDFDCFRHPFPPGVRSRNLSAKDVKPDLPTEMLGGKLDLLPTEETSSNDKNGSPPQGDNLPSVNLSPSHASADPTNQAVVTNLPKVIDASNEKNKLIDSQIDGRSTEFLNDDSKKEETTVCTVTNIPGENKQSELVALNENESSLDKKRKTTAGDLVNDFEAEPEESNAIDNACSLDVLAGDVCELELDDDELLGLGNDFNILEYADPELDKGLVGEGEKSNILDEHLDLDDKDELDEEEEMKGQGSSEEKDLIEEKIDNKELLSNVETADNLHKNSEKCEPSTLHGDFFNFEKREDKSSFKSEFKDGSHACETPEKAISEASDLIKKEPKVTFSSCSLSSTPFCSADIANTVKELHTPTQCSISFPNSSIQNLGPQQPSSVYAQQISASHFRVGNIARPHLQQSSLISPPPPRNIFPLHVGVPLRSSGPILQLNNISQKSPQNRPLLLQEQPLLLEDLVEQEKREQLRQTQEGLISPQGDALLSDIDFERLKDDVFSGPPDDSIGGPGSLLGSQEPLKTIVSPSSSSGGSGSSHSFGPPPYSLICQTQEHNVPCSVPSRSPVMQNVARPQVSNVITGLDLPPGIVLQNEPSPRGPPPQKSPVIGAVSGSFCTFVSTPPSPPVMDPHAEHSQEKQKIIQYEKFLVQQQAAISSQQKYFETEVIKMRKIKKTLNQKQRTLRKNGSELPENDALELARISQEQATLQKQLDQVRKQSRQHSLAFQDYHLKQQKRQQLQQQQQQYIAQTPVHASVSSLQSSPQSSHSPHQMNQATHTSQSPMLPSSPISPSASRLQHSPSPLLQLSPAAVSPSTVIQQSSPLVHTHLLSQQVHFQVSRAEGKIWAPLQISQINENMQNMEKQFPKESGDFKTSRDSQLPSTTTSTHLDKVESKGFFTPKSTEMPVLNVKVEDSNPSPMLKSQAEISHTPEIDLKTEIGHDADSVSHSTHAESILSQSLPSSVTNTLNFTLRQTGMPTVCLPTSDQGSIDDNTTQAKFLGLPSTKSPVVLDPKITDARSIKPESINDKNTLPDSVSKGSELDILKTEYTTNRPETFIPGKEKTSERGKSDSSSTTIKNEEIVYSYDIKNASDSNKVDIELDTPKETTQCPIKSSSVQSPLETPQTTEHTSVHTGSSSIVNTEEISIKLEHESPQTGTTMMPVTEVKQEDLSEEKKQEPSFTTRHLHSNDGSSDEELENLSENRQSSGIETEHDPGKQNVLLKQLLQNCPSAESKKPENFEVKKEDIKSEDLEINKDVIDKKLEDHKLKKPSYLDIRRAQLEKEPTPPPGEAKLKPPKRKRPKKKKLSDLVGKEESPAKKKCRKLSKADEIFGSPLENVITQLTNLPPLRILEPHIRPNFNVLPAFGAGDLNGKGNQLKGTYGAGLLPNQCDIYSYFPYGKDHATPTPALPLSPPYRGFYNQEFPPVSKGKSEMVGVAADVYHVDLEKTFRYVDSPDTVLSASSPEPCLFEPLSKLILIESTDEEYEMRKRKSYSPVVPLLTPIPIRIVPLSVTEITERSFFLNGGEFDEKDKENIPRCELKSDVSVLKSKIASLGSYSAPLKDTGNVSVTLTVSSAAAENIVNVLSRLADILKIPIPTTYEIVERTATPPSQKLGLYRKSKSSEMNIQSLLNGKPRFCRHCDIVVLSAGIRKKASDLACILPSKEEQEEDDEVIFCSTNCYMQFALTHRSSASALEDKEIATVVNYPMETDSILKDADGEPVEKSEDGRLEQNRTTKSLLEVSMDITDDDEDDEEDILMKGNNEFTFGNSAFEEGKTAKDELIEIKSRKWKAVRYKYWNQSCINARIFKANKDDSTDKVAKAFYITIKPNPMPKDCRRCIFCHVVGDGDTNGAARLLNSDVDKWVHLNCALWSAEVYETVNGGLMNVETAYKRAMLMHCCSCEKRGASLKCFKTRCTNTYHFPCALKENCVFFKDKTILCAYHASKGSTENELESVAVHRRVYIDRDEHKQVASMIQGDQYVMRIGSLIFLSIGQLLPTQMQAFHTPHCIYPVGYSVIRMYWSMRKLGRRCQYTCFINDVNGKPEFNIQVKEADHKDILLKDKTAKGIWQKIIYPIEKMRRQAKTIKLFPDFITGDDLFGLSEPAVLRIVESLPGVDTLQDYNFRYGRSPFLELPLAINPTGCARSEPKLRTHVKRSHTLHTSNTTRSSFHSTFGGVEISSPYIKQFVHSKSSQYRKMKTEWRNNVYLARSRIQGLGLYAARDLEKHTMVIEYIGQIIRNEIAERNEAVYESQNRGVYMFRLDENRVIDATLSGGLARYMNHSCNPNCVAEVVQIDRENKILIIANRRVTRGEELSYDYKFEVEDDQHKIPCLCKAPNCRKWMN